MINFIGFLFSLSKGTYNRCAIHKQFKIQASVTRIEFAGFFIGILSTSINKILLDAQTSEYNKKTNQYDPSTHTILRKTLQILQLQLHLIYTAYKTFILYH